jgi:hypothetical protein
MFHLYYHSKLPKMSSLAKLTLIIFLFFTLKFDVISQISLRTISQKLVNALPQEKVFLTFNKPYYSAGETIFFKAFAVMADNHKMDTLSGILYLDIVDAQTQVLKERKTLPLYNGVSYGSIETDSLVNNIKIIAYTRWMLNFSPTYMYQKTIPLISTGSLKKEATTPENETLNVQFFPESGNAVVGLASRMAVKSTDNKGINWAISGKILDNDGVFVDSFTTSTMGLGHFIFKATSTKTYKAVVSNGGQNTKEFVLPQAVDFGFTMFPDYLAASDKIPVYIQTNLPDNQMPNGIMLVAHTRGILNYGTKIDIMDKSNKSFFIEIPRNKFQKEGIVHLTLFTDKGIPLSERLIFNENKDERLTIQVKTDKQAYKPKEKIELAIDIHDAENKPISTDISLSVLDADKVNFNENTENILSYLLISSDLGLPIHNLYAYMNDTSFFTRQNMDWLMMTHGWRRFVWKEMLDSVKKTPPLYFPEYNSFMVNGNVIDKKKPSKIMANQNVLLILKDKNVVNDQNLWVQTDSTGSFSLENLVFYDSTTCFVKIADYKKEYIAKMTVMDTTPSVFPHFLKDLNGENSFSDDYLTTDLKNNTVYKEKTIALDTFLVKANKLSKIPKRDPQKMHYDKPNASVKIDQKTAASNMNLVEYLNGREGLNMSAIGNVKIRSMRGPVSFQANNSNSMPLVFIDGVQSDPQVLPMIPISEVEKVDIIRSANALYGSQGAYGVINVITKSGKGVSNVETVDGETAKLPSVKLKGFSIVREFYSPDYSDVTLTKTPDFRSSLYWSNTIKTDEKGQSNVIFYNSDNYKNGKIIIQCVDKMGRVGYLRQDFKGE